MVCEQEFNLLFMVYYGTLKPSAVVESVEHWSRMREIVGSNPSRVKPMTYQIDTCRFLARCSALLG